MFKVYNKIGSFIKLKSIKHSLRTMNLLKQNKFCSKVDVCKVDNPYTFEVHFIQSKRYLDTRGSTLC